MVIIMIKHAGKWSFKPMRIMLLSIIIGFFILPTFCNLVMHGVQPPKENVTTELSLPKVLLYSKTFDLPPNVYVCIDLPKNVTDQTGLEDLIVKVPKAVRVRVNISKVTVAFAPNELYDVYSCVYITFKDVKTGGFVEPNGYIEFIVSGDWLSRENYTPDKVIMLRYHNGWSKLKTKLIGSKGFSYEYKAVVPAFSYFTVAVYRVYNITYATDEGCIRCHPDVAIELKFSPYHYFNCTFCHLGMSRNVTCVQCHPNIGDFSAHKPLINWSENSMIMVSSNEACIACHTYAKILICNITYYPYMSFDYSWDTGKVLFKKIPRISINIKYWNNYTYESLNLSNKTPPSRSIWW